MTSNRTRNARSVPSWRGATLAFALTMAAALPSCGPSDPAPGTASTGTSSGGTARPPAESGPSAATPRTETAATVDPPAAPEASEPERCPGNQPGDLFPGFQATVRRPDGAGVREEAFNAAAAKGVTVYVANSTLCGYCAHYAPTLVALEKEFTARGVDFVYLYPVRDETDDAKVEFHREKGYAGGQILDADATIAKSLGVDRTPTVFIVDAKHVVAYRGAVDDAPLAGDVVKRRWAAEALTSVLAGKSVEVPSTEPAG